MRARYYLMKKDFQQPGLAATYSASLSYSNGRFFIWEYCSVLAQLPIWQTFCTTEKDRTDPITKLAGSFPKALWVMGRSRTSSVILACRPGWSSSDTQFANLRLLCMAAPLLSRKRCSAFFKLSLFISYQSQYNTWYVSNIFQVLLLP